MSCCPVTSEPARGASPSVGKIKKYGTTSLYVTGPANAKAGLIAYPDIFGMDSGRGKADADALGKLGYAVVMVDLTDGDYLEPDSFGPKFLPWLKKYPFDSDLSLRIADAINYLKNEAKVQRFASYGYCWGSWVGANQTTKAGSPILAHVSFHPTWAIQNMLYGDGAVDELAELVKVPQLLLSAGDDPDFVREGGSVEKILEGRTDIGSKCKVVDFPSMNHGWVHRGDLDDPATKQAVMKAWHEAVKFIQVIVPQH